MSASHYAGRLWVSLLNTVHTCTPVRAFSHGSDVVAIAWQAAVATSVQVRMSHVLVQ